MKYTYPYLTWGRGWVILENEKSANKPQKSNNLFETLYCDAGWDGTIRSEWGRVITPCSLERPTCLNDFPDDYVKPETKSLHLCALSRVLPSDAFDYGESRFDYQWSFFLFSSNKSLADSLDECVDAKDPNFNKVGSTNCSVFFFFKSWTKTFFKVPRPQ